MGIEGIPVRIFIAPTVLRLQLFDRVFNHGSVKEIGIHCKE